MEATLLERKLDVMVNYACEFIKVPYVWGGDDPQGMDCSGFAQECLSSVGWDLPGDQTAQELYRGLKARGWKATTLPEKGMILFFGQNIDSITHVAIAYDNLHMIEAGGGNPSTTTQAEAMKRNAFVRIRPIKNRKDFLIGLSVE